MLPAPLVIILTTAFAVVLPFFFLGNPSGHDFEFHVNSWMEVFQQWHQGIAYPRWAASAHYGYGEARFVFYPPLSWMTGAALGTLLPWPAVPGAFVWLVLTLSGCSMFFLAREFLAPRDTIFAAAFYAANPYYLIIIYWRSAFAELLAGALLPLLLLFVLRLDEQGRRSIPPLSLVVAIIWLSNAPSAVMATYSLALLAVMIAGLHRSPRILPYAALALVIGLALAAFYVLPAAFEEKWVNISEVLAPGVRPQDNFLFTTIADPDHNRFNLLVSLVASVEMLLLAAALIWPRRGQRQLAVWWVMLAWAAATTILMFPVTRLAWQYLPQLRFLQLPWRWLLCLNVAVALLVTMASRRWLIRALACLLMGITIVLAWQRVQPPWWDTAADIREMRDNIQTGKGYEGTDEYVPAGADPYEIDQQARRATFEGTGEAQIQVQRWDAEEKLLAAEVTTPGKLVMRLFDYPAWRVEVNGQIVAAERRDVTGQMMIPVTAGENRISIEFVRTWDRTAGNMISLLSALALLAWYRYPRRART